MAAPVERRPRPILVLALGNPILGDDGVAWAVADEVERRIRSAGPSVAAVEVDRLAVGGLTVMERLHGADRAILVDARATSAPEQVGEVVSAPLGDLGARPPTHLDSAHDAPLAAALEAGHALGIDLPRDLIVVTVAIESPGTFADGLSPAVRSAVAPAAEVVLRLATGSPPRDRRPAGACARRA